MGVLLLFASDVKWYDCWRIHIKREWIPGFRVQDRFFIEDEFEQRKQTKKGSHHSISLAKTSSPDPLAMKSSCIDINQSVSTQVLKSPRVSSAQTQLTTIAAGKKVDANHI